MYFRYVHRYYLHLGKEVALYLNKLEPISPNWPSDSGEEMTSLQTDGQTTRTPAIRLAHLSFSSGELKTVVTGFPDRLGSSNDNFRRSIIFAT